MRRAVLIGLLTLLSFASVAEEKRAPQPENSNEYDAKFDEGSFKNFTDWVYDRLKYPLDMRAVGLEGKVTVSFSIGTDGEVSKVRVLRGVCPSADAEAVEVISASPTWTPAVKPGSKPVENVEQTFVFPVLFALPNHDIETAVSIESLTKYSWTDAYLIAPGNGKPLPVNEIPAVIRRRIEEQARVDSGKILVVFANSGRYTDWKELSASKVRATGLVKQSRKRIHPSW